MKLLNHLPAWLRNKYFIAFSAFVIIVLFLDKNDLFTQYERQHELQQLRQSREYYTNEINSERLELEQLKRDPATLEKYAREKYLMKKDGEELFIIPEKHGKDKN
jgi:cell division protein DivIC